MKKLTPEDTSQQIKDQEEEEKLEVPSPYFTFFESWIKILGHNECLLYGVLLNRSRRDFFSSIADETLLKTFSCSLPTLKRWMARLEAKGAIFRFAFPSSGGGKKRCIIPFFYAQKYWERYMAEKEGVYEKFKDFVNFMSQAISPHTLLPSSPSRSITSDPSVYPPFFDTPRSIKNDTSAEVSKMRPRIHKDKRENIKYNILLQTSSLSESACSSSEEEEFKKFERELTAQGMSQEQIDVGRKFFAAFSEEINSKRFPTRYLISSIQRGFAVDRLREQEAKENPEQNTASPTQDLEQNRALAVHAVERFRDLPPGFRVAMGENCIHFSWQNGSSVVSLGDKNFSQRLEAHVRQIENLSRSASEASSVGEGQTIGEPILRFAAGTEKDSPNGSSNGPRKPSKGVRSSQNDSRVPYAQSGLKVPQSAFKTVWPTAPPNA